jgi:predicted nucleic acid-binding protein
MCIIVDTNSLHNVFDKTSQRHFDFKPIWDWIWTGKGKFITGGGQYKREIPPKYYRILNDLRIVNKVVRASDHEVDSKTAWVKEQIEDQDFDDPHIIALLIVSGAKLICSLDERAYPYLKDNRFFKKAADRPKIYSRLGNEDLLVDENIAEICKPSQRLTVGQQKKIQNP